MHVALNPDVTDYFETEERERRVAITSLLF